MTLSSEGEEVYEEVRILTKQEEIAIMKTRAREQTDPVEKLYGIYDLVTAYVAIFDDSAFRAEIRNDLNTLDLDVAAAANWIDKGWDPADFYKISCHNRLNDALMILAKVENRAILEGIMPVFGETVESLEEQFEIEALRDELAKLQMEREEKAENG